MAIKGRTELSTSINNNLPNNGAGLITAAKHREVLEGVNESTFNLKDDKLKDVNYDTDTKLAQHLAALLSSIVKKGSFSGVDTDSGTVGSIYTSDGIIQQAKLVEKAANANKVEITFTESITGKTIIPVVWSEGTWSTDESVMVTLKALSATKIYVLLREVNGDTQNNKIELIVL